MTRLTNWVRLALPGLLLSATIALAVRFISDRLGGPAMLYALLFGMAFNFLSNDERFVQGIQIASRNVLRIGVALLGLRISTSDVMDLGWQVLALVGACIVATVLFGTFIGRLLGLKSDQSVLSAGAVAICGASAALAIAAVLPSHKDHERNTVLTVVGVTALGTIAMIFYPLFVTFLGYDNTTAGVFLGATIHDVAQVVGAGYIISDETGEVSTLVKLLRVSFLVPVVIVISLIMRRGRFESTERRSFLPWFLVAFVVLVLMNSFGFIPAAAHTILTPVSSWCLLAAVAAIGVKTSLESFFEVGPAPMAAMLLQTIFLALFAIGGIALIG